MKEKTVNDFESDKAGGAPTRAGHLVAIYVTAHCPNCRHAQEVAALIQRDYPLVRVEVVDLAQPHTAIPDAVFAVPTYLLDGRLWSLGNPSVEQIQAALGA